MKLSDASETGAYVQPQLPTTSVVTPWRIVLSAVGFASSEKSLWLCGSTKPGHTTLPVASMTLVAVAPSPRRPTSTMFPPSIATSPRKGGLPAPSATQPLRIRVSSMTSSLLVGRNVRPEARVEDIAETVAEEVEAEHDDHDREPRE